MNQWLRKGNRGPRNKNRAPFNCTKPFHLKGQDYRSWPDLKLNRAHTKGVMRQHALLRRRVLRRFSRLLSRRFQEGFLEVSCSGFRGRNTVPRTVLRRGSKKEFREGI